LGKYVKSTFHGRDIRADAILERVHSDVCGPFSTTSISRQKYYVIFNNDFSKKCWILFTWKRDGVFSKFVEFKALVERETRKKVKGLRSDNGGEFVSNIIKDLCAKEGIRRELIVPHNP